jgi:hypothetical protein
MNCSIEWHEKGYGLGKVIESWNSTEYPNDS